MNNKNLKKPNIYSSRRGFLRVKMRDCKTKGLSDCFFTGEDTEGAAVLEIGHHKFPLRLRSRKVDGGLSAVTLEPRCPEWTADTRHLGEERCSVPRATADGWCSLRSSDLGRRQTQHWGWGADAVGGTRAWKADLFGSITS